MPAVTSALYAASPPKKRRSTRAEMESRGTVLLDIVLALAPATVRQVMVLGIVEKTEARYDRVERDLVALRRADRLLWRSINDNTRWLHTMRGSDS
jgi:hypothetical protein